MPINKKLKKKILIIGSNFSQKYHLRIIFNLFKGAEVHIASPNIKSKDLNTNIKISKYKNYKNAMKKNRYYLILCCALPSVQENFIKLLIYNNYSVNYLMLEKPLSRKIKLIQDLIEYSKSKKIKIAVNYCYSNIKIFTEMKKKIKNNKYFYLKFNYHFLHQYYVKKNNSWKNFISKGGGIVNYYLNHVIYSIIRQFKNIQLNKIEFKLLKKSIIGLKLELLNFKNQIFFDIKLKKKNYKHNYKLILNNRSFEFGTTYKNWYKKYYFSQTKFKKTKKIYYIEDFEKLILQNYKLLKNFKQDTIYENYLKDILLTEKICYQINSKIKNYDFQKM